MVSNASSSRLDRSLAHGLAWTGGATAVTQLFSWLVTLLVARLLTPDDYGIIGMAGTYLILAQLIGEFGLSAAIVQAREIPRDIVARAGGLAVLIGFVLFAVSAAFAGPVAAFFDEPRVRGVVLFLSLTFILGGFRVVPDALLLRDMAFRRIALIDTVEAVALAVVTLCLALLGFEYWALAAGPVVSRALGTVLVNGSRPHPLRLPIPPASLRGVVGFGSHVLASRIAWYLYSNADFAIVGRVLGSATLGLYTIGWNIATVPLNKISALYQKAVGPILAAAQNDPATVRRYVLRLSEAVALLTLPASVGLALVADDLVITALGEQWRAAGAPLALLAVASTLRSLDPILAQVLIWTGRPATNARIMGGAALIMPLLFLAGTRWGAPGVAAAWVVGYPLAVFVPLRLAVSALLQLGRREYLRALAPALVSTLVMTGVVLGARLATAGLVPPVRLALLCAAGATTFTGVLLLGYRERIRSARDFVRSVAASRTGSGS